VDRLRRRATANEEERGTIDWLLSTPLSRTQMLESLGALLAALAAGAALIAFLLISSQLAVSHRRQASGHLPGSRALRS
jgi:ABC-type transport system involved in multi-copper enzyme maturation permease subunit